MNEELFKGPTDYWKVSEVIKHLYQSDGSMVTLLDFERVIDDLDIYAFQNWTLGELVEGPELSTYSVSCTFMWPEHLMPDPRAAKRLVPFGCKVLYKKMSMQAPKKVKTEEDFIPNTKMPRLEKRKVWIVEITMPRALLTDIKTGSIELEDQTIDLEDLDLAYEADVEDDAVKDNDAAEFQDEVEDQGAEDEEQPFGEF